jgi:hypothetical protein
LSILLLLFLAAAAQAGPGYQVKLKSGVTYNLEQVSPGNFSVTNAAGTVVGAIHKAGNQFESFDTGGHSLGTAAHINPEAVALIDKHVSGGL